MYKLIEALRKTADHIENNIKEYRWSDPGQCNCGMLAQTVCNLPDVSVSIQLSKDVVLSTWQDMSRSQQRKQCKTTGMNMNVVFQKLLDVGMKWKDFTHLELLSNKAILARAGILPEPRVYDEYGNDINYYERPANTIRYMRAWADMLEEKLNKTPIRKALKLARSVEKTVQEIKIPKLCHKA